MTILAVAFFAGILTVLAPCVLPLLPVIMGTAVTGRSAMTPYVVVGSLALSIILFTFLLKVSTAFITVPPEVWLYLSGGILILFGITLLFPSLWGHVVGLHRIAGGSERMLGKGARLKTVWGDIIVGASLGPIFSTCSPTYFVILASILPVSFAQGTVYILAYTLGLSLVLLLIALLGAQFAKRLGSFANPYGWFKRSIGVLFIALGLLIALGLEKKLEILILESGYFNVTNIEYMLLEKITL